MVPDPASLFKEGDYLLIRELNPNHALKPGEKAGAGKLKGAVRGPFRYVGVSPQSEKYCAIQDSNGKIWDKAFHDVVPYDNNRPVNSYKISEFPVSTKEAVALEKQWQLEAAADNVKPDSTHKNKKKKKTDDDEDYYDAEDIAEDSE